MLLDLSLWQLGAILATYMFAAGAKGITGLGFSTTCLPILALLVGLKDALPLVILPSICSNLIVMRQAGRFGDTVARFWPMLLALLPGLALGLWALSHLDGAQAGAALGLLLLIWCAFSAFKPDLSLPPRWERPIMPLSGLLTGLINGVTGSQVMPAVPVLMMLRLERNMFLQAVNCSFTLSSLVMAVGLGRLGLFSLTDALVSALGTGFVLFGLRLGARIRDRLSEDRFRIALLVMLGLMGLSLIAAGIV